MTLKRDAEQYTPNTEEVILPSSTPSHQNVVIAAIPAYNEAATVGSVVLSADKYVDQVVVVDDGSTDSTADIAQRAGALILQINGNQGKGAAVARAFDYAQETNVNQCVLLDADWQHDPNEIPQLLDRLQSADADVIIGNRYLCEDGGDTPRYRRLGQITLDKLTSFGIETSVSDSQSGYRVFSRKALESIDIQDTGFGVETEILRSAVDNDLKIEEAPITVNYDVPNPSTSNSVIHGVSVVNTILEIVRDQHPLLFFGVPGFTLMMFGLGYGIYTMSLYDAGQGFDVAKALYSCVTFLVGVLSVYSALIMNMLDQRLDRAGSDPY